MAVAIRRDTFTPTNAAASALTDATFRAFATAVENMLLDAGFASVSDTDRMDLAAVTWPATAVYAGWRLYSMDDTINGTSPLYMKVWFGRNGSSSGATCIFNMRFEFGTSSNGSGTLSPTLDYTGTSYYLVVSNSGTTPWDSYANGDDAEGWRWGVMRPNNNGTPTLTIIVERTRASTSPATPTGDGVRLTVAGMVFTGTSGTNQDLRTRQVDFTDSLAYPTSGSFSTATNVAYNASATMYGPATYGTAMTVWPAFYQRRADFPHTSACMWSNTPTDNSTVYLTFPDGKVRKSLMVRLGDTANFLAYPCLVVD